MKKNLLLILMASCCFQCQAPEQTETAQICCSLNEATTSFVLLSHDAQFVRSHDEPKPLAWQATAGEELSFATKDGKKGKGFWIKAPKKTTKYIFVFHEWWGLNDYIKREAEKLAKDVQAHVIALDLYDGEVATKREEAAKLMQSVLPERALNIIEGAKQWAGKQAKIATIGWCFGGGWSLQASIALQKSAKACIIYYGMPEKDKAKLQQLQAPVLGIFAGREKWINQEIVQTFEATLKSMGKKATIKTFDAEHAFANPSNPNYDQAYTEEAYQMSLAFLKKHL